MCDFCEGYSNLGLVPKPVAVFGEPYRDEDFYEEPEDFNSELFQDFREDDPFDTAAGFDLLVLIILLIIS